MKTLKDIIMVGSDLNAKVVLNVNSKDIEIEDIIFDCVDGTMYLYDKEFDYDE